MQFLSKKYILIFTVFTIVISCVFLFIPINIFDGEIKFKVNDVTFIEKAKLSLSYFIGIGASKHEIKDVIDFYLLPTGYLNVFLLIFCLPLLISYRFYLNDINKSNK